MAALQLLLLSGIPQDVKSRFIAGSPEAGLWEELSSLFQGRRTGGAAQPHADCWRLLSSVGAAGVGAWGVQGVINEP